MPKGYAEYFFEFNPPTMCGLGFRGTYIVLTVKQKAVSSQNDGSFVVFALDVRDHLITARP